MTIGAFSSFTSALALKPSRQSPVVRASSTSHVKPFGEWGADGIRQNSGIPREDWEPAAFAAWLADGATAVKATRLLILGSRHRHDRVGEVYRDIEAIEAMKKNALRWCEGLRAHAACHAHPASGLVLCDARATSRAVTKARVSIPIRTALDMGVVLQRAPEFFDASDEALTRVATTTMAVAEALDVKLDDERLKEIVEIAPKILLADSLAVVEALEQLRPLSRDFSSFAAFVADNSEAVLDSHFRSTLAQTMSMRKSYRV